MSFNHNEIRILNNVMLSARVTQTATPNTTLGEIARSLVLMDDSDLSNTLHNGIDESEEYKTLLREVIASEKLSELRVRYPYSDDGTSEGFHAICVVEPSGEATIVYLDPGANSYMLTEAKPSMTRNKYVSYISKVYDSPSIISSSPTNESLPSADRHNQGYDARVKLDTENIRNYAQQVKTARSKISNVRQTLLLLASTGNAPPELLLLLDGALQQKYDSYLVKCVEYLELTADAFDKAEKTIVKLFDETEEL